MLGKLNGVFRPGERDRSVGTRRRLGREKGGIQVSGKQGQLARIWERMLGIWKNPGAKAGF